VESKFEKYYDFTDLVEIAKTNFGRPYQAHYCLNGIAYNQNSSIISGNIPGDGGGQSSGRMGGLMKISSSGNYALAYSRIPCTTSFEGTVTSNTINEIALIMFDNMMQSSNYFQIATNINASCLKSVRYGINILITYTISSANGGGQFLPDYVSDTDTMYMILVNMNGGVVTSTINVNPFSMSASDDMVVLNNGDVIWTFVNASNVLNVYSLPVPKSPGSTSTSQSGGNPTQSGGSPTQSGGNPTQSGKNPTQSEVNTVTTEKSDSRKGFCIIISLLFFLFN